MANIARGAYVLYENEGDDQVVLMATGSEVELAMQVARRLADQQTGVRVVSMPCWERFDAQPESYRHAVLPPGLRRRVSLEAGVTAGWHRYAGDAGVCLGLDRFGESAPGDALFDYFGFRVEQVMQAVESLLH